MVNLTATLSIVAALGCCLMFIQGMLLSARITQQDENIHGI